MMNVYTTIIKDVIFFSNTINFEYVYTQTSTDMQSNLSNGNNSINYLIEYFFYKEPLNDYLNTALHTYIVERGKLENKIKVVDSVFNEPDTSRKRKRIRKDFKNCMPTTTTKPRNISDEKNVNIY